MRVFGRVVGVATRKVTLSLDVGALALAEIAAARAGLSTSAWMSRAARREAIRTGYTPQVDSDHQAAELAAADEADRLAAEEDMRAAG